MENNTYYVECACHEFTHITRLYFDKEDEMFSLEFHTMKFPGLVVSPINTKWDEFKFTLMKVANYFKQIWWAILGRPIWYHAYAVWDKEEILKMIDFINERLGESNDK